MITIIMMTDDDSDSLTSIMMKTYTEDEPGDDDYDKDLMMTNDDSNATVNLNDDD